MRIEILASAVMAVAIHALVLSAPLSETKHRGTRAPVHEPIAISIIPSMEAVASVPPLMASRQTRGKPGHEVRSHVSARHTVVSKKKAAPKKRLARKNVTPRNSTPINTRKLELAPDPDNQNRSVEEGSPEKMREVREKMIGGSHSIKTASINGHVRGGRPRHMGVSQEAQGGIVYARPKYKENPLPHYPKVAKRRGYEGRTLLMVQVLENGRAGEIEIKESSGFKVLDTAALHSVRGWTFVPGTVNGEKTEQWIRVPIRFVLK